MKPRFPRVSPVVFAQRREIPRPSNFSELRAVRELAVGSGSPSLSVEVSVLLKVFPVSTLHMEALLKQYSLNRGLSQSDSQGRCLCSCFLAGLSEVSCHALLNLWFHHWKWELLRPQHETTPEPSASKEEVHV